MLFVFVEGYFDECYFSKVFFLGQKNVKFVQYSSMKPEKVNSYIKSIDCMESCNYLFFGDCDGNSIEAKQASLLETYSSLEKSKLYIVQYEIESWYYAGICESDCIKLKLKHFVYCTDAISKEILISKMKKPSDKQYILAQMLECYSVIIAVQRNQSLKFFVDHYINKPVAAV